ncbi:helix-turn-helix domain-containing protein [Butyrivibrio sp. INlla21]|uniref:helix-turn-helix domain-containing protein n=1 Tax=Butyrivibrio sp. INlla21 TaxID=1520811 RepID=UPI0008E47AF6|nr:helix-turn-helix transcriptional regulator [Butyrivibrio sp. INlla21]SFU98798.1 Helix-turn-helix [Butyrivibrio sp. INlla21]
MKDNFKTWEEARNELYTPEEISESDLRVALMGELVKARKELGLSQRELEKISGVKQPVIARIESGVSSPKLDTVVKLLAALGKKLTIVPMR